MNTAKGTRVQILDNPEVDSILQDFGVGVSLRGRIGTIVSGVVTGNPPQVEVFFDNMEQRYDSWYIPIDPKVMVEVKE